jgi:hypothetical protein
MLPIALALLLTALAVPATADCEKEVVGGGVTLDRTTPIAELLAQAPERVGERVAVEGRVTAICQMMGCWLELQAADGPASIRVKVDDGVIVFPKWAAGKAARAEGTVERLELSREDYLIQREHEAHEAGVDFDEATAEGDGPFHVYRLRGTGAEICR